MLRQTLVLGSLIVGSVALVPGSATAACAHAEVGVPILGTPIGHPDICILGTNDAPNFGVTSGGCLEDPCRTSWGMHAGVHL